MWSVSFDRSCSLGAAVRKSAGADELWGGKLRGAVLSRAAHIVFLRIQVKHAQGSDLMRDPLDGNRPGPPPRSSSGLHPFAHNGVARRRTLARLGEPSGDQHDQWILQFFLRYVHAGLNLREVIDTPAWHTEHSPRSSGRARHADVRTDRTRARGLDPPAWRYPMR